MALQIFIKPIDKWIGPETKNPGNSQFRKTYADTKKILAFELEKLNALPASVQLEMFIKPEDLLRAGTELRAHHKPYKPGVVLSFTIITRRLRNKETGAIRNETKTLSYPCDTFNDWQDNVRAIALSLEKLRAVARYGVFKYEDIVERLALPSPTGESGDKAQAAVFLAIHSSVDSMVIMTSQSGAKSAYREAAAKLHPDKGGSNDDFQKLQEAKKILGI